eukprot:Sspe_Gene.48548::Locus_25385_Transcript_1_1_Confidence_1.000_Length_1150::g.48548::m.48548/K00876/udk, UCK; uridine kinase
MDAFYKTPTPEELADIANYNFDHPNAFDFALIAKCLQQLLDTGATHIPTYSFVEHKRMPETEAIENIDVVVFEGILALHDPKIRHLLDLKIFVDTDLDTCLVRRIRRDISERGRTVETVLDQYERTVKPSYESFIAPLKKYADIIIPRGGQNVKAIQMVTLHISKQLNEYNGHHDHRDTDETAYHPLQKFGNGGSPLQNSPTIFS